MAIGGAQELLQFLITANGQQAIKEINAVGAAAARQEQIIAKSNKRSAAALTALGAKQVGFGLVAGAGIVAAASAAADLDKSLSRVNATFGAGAESVAAWARNANEVFLSDRQAASYAANIGEAAQGLGLAADESARLVPEVLDVTAQLAVLKGLDMDNSIESIAAALRGEFDATQKLVPALSAKRIVDEALVQTGKERAEQLTTAEKAYATLNIVLEDGTQIIEGNSEALDSLDARWQQTKSNLDDALTSFGAGALPAVEGLAAGARIISEAFGKIPEPVLKGGAALATIGATASLAVGGFNLVRGGLEKLRVPLAKATTNVSLLAQAFPRLAAFGTAGAVAAVAGGIYLISQEAAKAERKIRDSEAALVSFNKAAAADDVAESWEQLARLAENAESTFDGLADTLLGEGAALEVEGVKIEMENLLNVVRDFAKAGNTEGLENIQSLLEGIQDSLPSEQDAGFWDNVLPGGREATVEGVGRALQVINDELGILDEKAAGAEGGLGDVGAAGEDAGEGLDDAAEAAERLSDALGSFDAIAGVTEGILAQAESVQEIAEAEAALQEARASGKQDEIAAAERDVAAAYLSREQAAVDLLEAVQNVADLGPQAVTDLKASLLQAAEGGILPPDLVAQTIGRIDEIITFAEANSIELQAEVQPPTEDPIIPWLTGKVEEWKGVPFKAPLEIDDEPATSKRDAFIAETEGLTGEVEIDGDTQPGKSKRDQFIEETRGKDTEVDIDGDPSRGQSKRDQFIAETRGKTATVNVDADTTAARAKIRALSGARVTATVALDGAGAQGASGLPEIGALAGPGLTLELDPSLAARVAGSSQGVGTYINNQVINLPRGADAREVEAAQRRYAARNGSPRR